MADQRWTDATFARRSLSPRGARMIDCTAAGPEAPQ